RPGRGARSERRARRGNRRDRRAARLGQLDGQAVTWQPKVLGDFLQERIGSSEALVTPSARLSYEDLFAKAKQAAGSMQAQGIGRGDPVAILLTNGEQWLALVYGAVL